MASPQPATRLEFANWTTGEFWTVERQNSKLVETFGLIGEKGQRRALEFASKEQADQRLMELIAEREAHEFARIPRQEPHLLDDLVEVVLAECDPVAIALFLKGRQELREWHRDVDCRAWREGHYWLPVDEEGEVLMEGPPANTGLLLRFKESDWSAFYRYRTEVTYLEEKWTTEMADWLSQALGVRTLAINEASSHWHLFAADGEVSRVLTHQPLQERLELFLELQIEPPVLLSRASTMYTSPGMLPRIAQIDRCVMDYRPVPEDTRWL